MYSRRTLAVASWFGTALAALAALSCNDALTTPRDPPPPLVFETRLPRALAAAGPDAALQLVPFDRVRIMFRRLTGTVAVDTTFATQPDADSVAIKLNIPLQLSVATLGETMTFVVTCINAQGTAVYRGGPAVILVRPGVSPAPVVIQLAYVGAGSVASTIQIVPNALSVLLGQPFSFTATVFDQSGAPIADAPIVWSVLEPSLARLTSPLGGIGAALTTAGVAHVVAQVPDGPADTATLTIQPPTDVTRILQLISGGGQSGLIGALLGAPIVVRLVNGAGNGVAGVPLTFTPSNGGTVTSPAVNTDANGRAQTSWTLGSLIGAQSLTVNATGLTGSALTVPATGLALPPPIASALQFTSSLTSAVAGSPLATTIVRALDDAGHLVTSFTSAVTITLGDNPGGATLSGTRTVSAVGGIATFSNLSLDKVASGYTLVATTAGVPSVTSSAFSISHAAASILAMVSGNNQTSLVGLLLGTPLTAKVTDPFDNPVPGVAVAWSVLAGGGLLGSATTQTDASGIASNTWTLGLLVGVQRVTATVSGLSGSPLTYSATGTALVPGATKIALSSVPATAVAGAALGVITASATDDAGAVATGFASDITIALGTNPGGATLSGTRTVRATNGVATFSDLSLDKAASGYTLVVSASGLTSMTSSTLSITHAAASLLAIAGGNNQTGLVSALLGSPLAAKVTDPFDNPVSGVTVAWGVLAGGGLLGSATTLTNASGIASTTWTLGLLAGVQRVTATANGLTGSPLTYSATATALAPVATRVAISALQATAVAGVPLASVVVSATDDAGIVVSTFANDVSISLGNNSGSATLSGTKTARAVNGVATFTTLSLDKAASGYTLTATSAGLASATSGTFSITHAAASLLAIAGGNNQTGLVSALLGSPLAAKVTDPFDNPVSGVTVAWGVLAGGGLLGSGTTQTNASGIASNTWTLGLLAGVQQVTASASGLAGSPLTYSATATALAPVATKLAMSALQSSAVAGTALTGVIVTATDDAGQVASTFTNNVSIVLGSNAGGATLSGTLTVRAVNGVATFGDVSLDKAASGYTLTAASTGLSSVTSSAFSITHAAAAVLALAGGDNQSGPVGALLGAPLTARITDAFGNVVPGAPVTWSVLAGAGSLGSATTQTNTSGVTSNAWTLGPLAGVQRVTASASGLTGSPLTYSATATALAPVATALVMSTVQTTGVAGAALSSIVVTAVDDAGATVTSFVSNISVTLGTNTGGATLSGTLTMRAANGVATFRDLSLDKAASGYTLAASASGLTSATSGPFSITHAAASILSIAGGNNQSALLSALLPSPVTVLVTDAFGNAVPGQSVSWAVTLGGGFLGAATTQTNASGIASNSWTLGALTGLQHATAAASGLSGSPAIFTATALLGLFD